MNNYISARRDHKKIIQIFCMGFLFFFLIIGCGQESDKYSRQMKMEHKDQMEYALVLHGGAGTILKENMTAEKEAAYKSIIRKVLDKGAQMLSEGASSLDVVEATIIMMEDSPLFNAGKGAVFTHEGKNEMDASIMTGQDQNAGAVGGVQTIRNPIRAARAVLEKSDHVLLTGKGAEEFATAQGCNSVDPKYFHTDRRWESLQRAIKKEQKIGSYTEVSEDEKFGTVGVVALDKSGNICAGTSTGGMTNKKYGRIGDSPIIGAGTYADNSSCGISSTGHGEYFIRYAVAYDIAARMEYSQLPIDEAARQVIQDKLPKKGGNGGVVGLDKFGNITMQFNTKGMYRGYINPKESYIGIYHDD